MNLNMVKVLAAAVIAIALLIVIVQVSGADAWAVPLLTGLVFYVIGNAKLTSREGNFAPIIEAVPKPHDDNVRA